MNPNIQEQNWKLFFRLINMVVIGCVVGLTYLLFHQSFEGTFVPQVKSDRADRNRNYKNGQSNDLVVNGIHVQTGLAYDQNFELVRSTCTACHSAKLVTQNRASRAGWQQMIDWMQETQGLWELGKSEPIIVDYLAKHYAPEQMGRRPHLNIDEVKWYVLSQK